jgi:hypothetical protein
MPSNLVFRAVVESIECAPLGARGGFLDWVVRTRVESVIGGSFDGEHFSFRVHSPSRAGLCAGTRCTVTARWTGDGYFVDENQWHSSPSY